VILPTDIPTRAEIDRLLEYRAASSVSIYLPTDPKSNGDPERIEFKSLAAQASSQLREAGAGVRAIREFEDEIRGRARALRRRRNRTRGDFRRGRHAAGRHRRAVPGTVDDQTGTVTFAREATHDVHDVTDEIARRAWLSGARVLAVRDRDIPGRGPAAAILRYAL
jgi:hypothetical protein